MATCISSVAATHSSRSPTTPTSTRPRVPKLAAGGCRLRQGCPQRPSGGEANVAGRIDLGGLAPTTVILAAADPLRSEGEALADALRRAGVWVDMTLYEGVTHGFFGLYQIVNKAMFAQAQLARNLSLALGT